MAGYLLFGMVSNLLPNEPIVRHVEETLEKQDLQSDFFFAFVYHPSFYMDNFTDALILNQACSGGRDALLTNTMLMPRRTSQRVEEAFALRSCIGGDADLPQVYYARYWHGSTFLMRWLLLLDDYVGLRSFFYIVSSLLLLLAVVAVARRVGLWVSLLWVLSMAMVNLFMMQFSIQFLPVLLLALGATIWVVYRVWEPRQMAMLMFVVGSLTAYFDLLTCPMLTWGVPVCVWLVSRRHEQAAQSLWQGVRTLAGCSLLWAVGYGATWVGKWLLATAVTPMDVVRDGIAQFTSRVGEGADFARWDALVRNFNLVAWPYFCIALVLLLLLALFRFNRNGVRTSLLLLLTAAVPCVWYLATANHAYLHYWFTYRSIMVVLFALLLSAAVMVDWKRLRTALCRRHINS